MEIVAKGPSELVKRGISELVKASPTTLVVAFNEVEELELVAIVDLLRRADIEVTVANLGKDLKIGTSQKTRITADALLSDVENKDFDAVVLPGGVGVYDITENALLGTILKRHFAEKKVIGAICAAPLILATQGIDKGATLTGYKSVESKITAKGYQFKPDRVIVTPNKVVTGRGPGVALDFPLKLIEVIRGREAAQKVADWMLIPLP